MANEFYSKMAEIYNKLQDGTAAKDEKYRFDSEICQCCMREDVLMHIIRREATRLKKAHLSEKAV